MPTGLAVEVDLVDAQVAVGAEEPVVPVGRRQHRHHAVPRPDQRAAELDILHRHAGDAGVDDGEQPQQLLHRTGHRRRIGQPGHLLRVAQQQRGGEPDHVGGGLVPGDQQQHPGRGDLAQGEVLPGRQPAQDVVPGLGPLAFGEPAQVVQQLFLRPGHVPVVGRGGEQQPAVRLELLAVLVRDAQQQADDEGGHRQGEVGDQVGGPGRAAPGDHPVQRLVHDLLDAGAHLLHPLDQEVPGDHPAQPGVLGVVEAEEGGVGGDEFAPPLGEEGERGPAGVGAEPAVREHRTDLLVAGDQPAGGAVREFGAADRAGARGLGVGGRRRERAGRVVPGRDQGDGGGGCAQGGLLA